MCYYHLPPELAAAWAESLAAHQRPDADGGPSPVAEEHLINAVPPVTTLEENLR